MGKPKLRGPARMAELGNKRVVVYLDPHELRAITDAAKASDLPLSTYIRRAAFEVALRSRFQVYRHGFKDFGPGGDGV